MDFVRRHVGGGSGIDVVLVALLPVCQRSDGERRATFWGVFGTEERGKCLVRGNDVGIDGVRDLPGQALLVFGRDACRIFLCREQKRISVDDSLTLHGKFLDEESDGHEFVFDSSAQDFGGLTEHAGNLAKPGDVVFIVLDRIKRDGKREVCKTGMNAVLLIDWHLVLFEIEVGDALLQNTNEEVVRELVLIGETRTRDGFKPGKEGFVGFVALGNRVERILGELVVVAIVAIGRGAFGKVAEIGLVLLFEKSVLGGEAISNWFEVLGEDGTCHCD